MNQIGSLTETLDAINWRRKTNTPQSSAIAPEKRKTRRSRTSPWRQTPGQIKTGSLSRTDRVAKYNQLLRIEEELGEDAIYGGKMR